MIGVEPLLGQCTRDRGAPDDQPGLPREDALEGARPMHLVTLIVSEMHRWYWTATIIITVTA